MKIHILLYILLGVLMSGIVIADFGFNNPKLPQLQPLEEEPEEIIEGANYSINVNRTEFWDDLDSPDDIDWLGYIIQFFNQWLNTTSDVQFNSVNTTEVNINGTNIFDLVTNTDTRGSTLTVCASNALDTSICNYVCDGTADQNEINTAMSSLSNGGTIVLSDGIFELSGTIDIPNDNIVIQGQGTSTILKGHQFTITAKDYIVIKDLQINGSTNGIQVVDDTDYLMVRNVFFNNINYGIITDFATSDRLSFYDNNFYNVINSIKIEDANNVFFTGNSIDTASGYGVYVNNVDKATFSNNNIYSTTKAGFYTASDNSVINNNIIDTTEYGIFIPNGANDNLISNNLIKSSTKDGISLVGDRNIVSNNRFLSNSGYGINITSNADESIINGNNLLYNSGGSLNNSGVNTNIANNYPGGSSMEVQTASGQEIKMRPEGVTTNIYYDHVTMTGVTVS